MEHSDYVELFDSMSEKQQQIFLEMLEAKCPEPEYDEDEEY